MSDECDLAPDWLVALLDEAGDAAVRDARKREHPTAETTALYERLANVPAVGPYAGLEPQADAPEPYDEMLACGHPDCPWPPTPGPEDT